MLEEKIVKRDDKDIIKHDKTSMFLRPRLESASVARTSPPAKHPMKKDEAGSPVMNELAHSSPHSDMIDVCEGRSQDHEFFGSWQMLEAELQLTEPGLVQCQDGSASVNTLMNVCCASKTQANETRIACKNWVHPKSPMHRSIVSSSDRSFLLGGRSYSERSGVVESAIHRNN